MWFGTEILHNKNKQKNTSARCSKFSCRTETLWFHYTLDILNLEEEWEAQFNTVKVNLPYRYSGNWITKNRSIHL